MTNKLYLFDGKMSISEVEFVCPSEIFGNSPFIMLDVADKQKTIFEQYSYKHLYEIADTIIEVIKMMMQRLELIFSQQNSRKNIPFNKYFQMIRSELNSRDLIISLCHKNANFEKTLLDIIHKNNNNLESFLFGLYSRKKYDMFTRSPYRKIIRSVIKDNEKSENQQAYLIFEELFFILNIMTLEISMAVCSSNQTYPYNTKNCIMLYGSNKYKIYIPQIYISCHQRRCLYKINQLGEIEGEEVSIEELNDHEIVIHDIFMFPQKYYYALYDQNHKGEVTLIFNIILDLK